MQSCLGMFSKAAPAADVTKLKPGIALPHVTLPTTEGGRVEIGAPTGRWQLVVVYRGKHDPVCVTYLAALQHLMPEFEEQSCDVVAVSADSRGKACSFVDDLRGAVLAVAYGLNEEQMRRWGLYVSRPLGPEESITLFSGMC
ncbi:hypothetical protein CHLNCDRAFT_137609 [Chlorella variabilis]|uniref:Alkyl hydroperoxide reductase subunit C/ Thiol specific antioxidant domain-containing protein n=1 Tax=Chlorella variabilis TaxID=554065 RepID=E1Z432_CHLVA|nr:hypothetical protein CHLNCDRAFT_137609 [Chlorella variabilis]EFN59279.1 hypothetical protein CHLNCDRAFT_137609 [Chlorella variabilis]|eukprot:XP_005851381.1 hypothetical protein CHLNCDRAFT_137609 [Chlorella variabilis]